MSPNTVISGSAAQKVSNSGKGGASGGNASGYGERSPGGPPSSMPTPSGPSKVDGNKAATPFGNERSTAQTGNNGGAGSGGTNKDRSRDLSTAKTAQSTTANANPNANRTIGHYVVGK